jgi:hypothetical protein
MDDISKCSRSKTARSTLKPWSITVEGGSLPRAVAGSARSWLRRRPEYRSDPNAAKIESKLCRTASSFFELGSLRTSASLLLRRNAHRLVGLPAREELPARPPAINRRAGSANPATLSLAVFGPLLRSIRISIH